MFPPPLNCVTRRLLDYLLFVICRISAHGCGGGGLPRIQKYSNVHLFIQVILRWELDQGMVINPRTRNIEHMHDNLDLFSWTLSDSDSKKLAALSLPEDRHPKIWYVSVIGS